MNNKEILEKALQKAINNGWSFALIWAAIEPEWKWEILDGDETIEIRDPKNRIRQGYNYYWTIDWFKLIFNHDFAKALWNESYYLPVNCPDGKMGCLVNHAKKFHMWHTKLQEMVIADDPIRYLGENLD